MNKIIYTLFYAITIYIIVSYKIFPTPVNINCSTLAPSSLFFVKDIFSQPASNDQDIDLFYGTLADQILIQKEGNYSFRKMVIFSDLSEKEKIVFARALFNMSEEVAVHKLTLINFAFSGISGGDIFAAIDDSKNQWKILALQAVYFEPLAPEKAHLATWISADRHIRLVANQVLAFTINHLLKQGLTHVDSSNVAYTERVRELLPRGTNNSAELKTFINGNARNLIGRLKQDSFLNQSAASALQKINISLELSRQAKTPDIFTYLSQAA